MHNKILHFLLFGEVAIWKIQEFWSRINPVDGYDIWKEISRHFVGDP